MLFKIPLELLELLPGQLLICFLVPQGVGQLFCLVQKLIRELARGLFSKVFNSLF